MVVKVNRKPLRIPDLRLSPGRTICTYSIKKEPPESDTTYRDAVTVILTRISSRLATTISENIALSVRYKFFMTTVVSDSDDFMFFWVLLDKRAP